MFSYYQLLPVEDVQKDEKSIIETLTAARDNKLANDISLLNLYREVPISFGATVGQIEKGFVEMTVHQLQAVVMKLQKETIIRSSHFKRDVVAKVTRSEPDKNFAFLSQFSYVQMLTDRRAHVRVKVSEQIEVTFRTNQLMLQGRLQDISVGGMLINATGKQELKENVKGEIYVTLDGDRLQVPAIFLRSAEACPEMTFAFMFYPDSKCEKIISNFVFQIQSEVIRELKAQLV